MNDVNYLKKKAEIIVNLYNTGKFEEVIIACKTLLKKFPEQIIFFNATALSFASLNKNIEGINILKQALKYHNDNILILNNLGLLNSNINNNKLARQYYDRALGINKNFIDVLVNKGHLELAENKSSDAENLFLKALSLSKNSQQKEIINIGLGQLYQQIGDFNKSLKIFNEILKFNPSNTKVHKSISVMHTYNDKHDTHLKMMEEQLSYIKDKDLLESLYFALGKAYEDLEDYGKSFEYLKKGNEILNKKNSYNINDDIVLFNNIKTFFKNLNHKNISQSEQRFIFIVGMPRSGTTLTEQIISSHSNVFSAGELPFLNRSISKYLIDNKFSFENIDLKIFNQIKNEYHEGINSFDYDGKIVTDKAPLNFRWIGFIKILFPDSKIIHCKRNPMDVCFSNYKNSFNSKALSFGYDFKNLSNYYKLYEDLMDFWNTKITNGIYNLSYENLINNYEEETKKIIQFCDLDWEVNCLKSHKNKSKVATASLAQVRKPIYKSSLNKWEKYSNYLGDLKKNF